MVRLGKRRVLRRRGSGDAGSLDGLMRGIYVTHELSFNTIYTTGRVLSNKGFVGRVTDKARDQRRGTEKRVKDSILCLFDPNPETWKA
jgi:hypothetical protein